MVRSAATPRVSNHVAGCPIEISTKPENAAERRLIFPEATKQDGERHHRAAARHGQNRWQAQTVLKALAGAAAQRSLCGAGQAGGMALARGFQAARNRRHVPFY